MGNTAGSRRHTRVSAAVLIPVAGAGVSAASLFLPWHNSGARHRSAFELLIAIDRLDVSLGPVGESLAWVLPFVPALAAAVAVALAIDRPRWVVMLAITAALLVAIPAVASSLMNGVGTAGEIGGLLGAGLTAVGAVLWSRQEPMPARHTRATEGGRP